MTVLNSIYSKFHGKYEIQTDSLFHRFKNVYTLEVIFVVTVVTYRLKENVPSHPPVFMVNVLMLGTLE